MKESGRHESTRDLSPLPVYADIATIYYPTVFIMIVNGKASKGSTEGGMMKQLTSFRSTELPKKVPVGLQGAKLGELSSEFERREIGSRAAIPRGW